MRNFAQSVILLLAILLVVSGPSTSVAQNAMPFSYQGMLNDSVGNPLTGLYSITFSLHDAATGGTELWSETHPSVAVSGGTFNVMLGSVTPIPLDVLAQRTPEIFWLEIQVGADPPLSPRTELLAVPYAAVSQRVSGDIFTGPGMISILPEDDDWQPLPDTSGVFIYSHVDSGSAMHIVDGSGWLTEGAITTGVLLGTYATQGTAGTWTSRGADTISSVQISSDSSGAGLSMFWDDPIPGKRHAINMVADASVAREMWYRTEPITGDTNSSVQISVDSSGASLIMTDSAGDTGVEIGWEGSNWLSNFAGPLTSGGDGTDGGLVIVNAAGDTIVSYTDTLHMAGPLGIGTSNPDATLDVNGVARVMQNNWPSQGEGMELAYDPILNRGYIQVYNRDSTSWGTLALGNGNVGIGTTSPTAELQVVGDICYTGSIGACSDGRYKENVAPLSGALDKVSSLQGVSYDWKQAEFPEQKFDDKSHIGFIAQELEELYPEMVMTDDDGYKSVDYGRLTPVLVEAMKEQQQQIDELRRIVNELLAANQTEKTLSKK